jgi:DNA invertase Pin-like site-specific DNA recombinase
MLGIYCRTSKSREEKQTIENQREEGIRCSTKLGIGFKVYIDDGVSGTLDETVREGLSDLLHDIKKKVISHVYCFDQSRIERDTRTWDFFVAECINNGVEYYPGGTKFELNNDTNIMLAKLMSVVNSYYSEMTSKKVRLANARKAKEGKTHGLKPYGYKKGKDNKYEINEIEAQNVKRMFQMSLNGIGAYTIANIFNQENIPTKFSGNFKGEITRRDKITNIKTKYQKEKVLWRGNVISDMLKNKMYKGIREWWRHEDYITYESGERKKEKRPVELILYKDIPVIIDPKLWDAVSTNLENNKKNVGKKEHYHYLLNGLIYCKHCGNMVIGKKRLKGNDNAYKCKGKRPPNKICTDSRGISLPKLETFIVEHLFKSRELKNLLINAPKSYNQSTKFKKQKAKKESEKSYTIKVINRLFSLLNNPELESDDKFVSEYLIQKKKLELIENDLKELEIKIKVIDKDERREKSKSLIENYFDGIEFKELKQIVHSLIDKIVIRHNKENKGGFFVISIDYKNYDEQSIFTTNWQCNKWKWVSYYRGLAMNDEDLENDYELAEYLSLKSGLTVPNKSTFKGFQQSSPKSELIILDNNKLINYD